MIAFWVLAPIMVVAALGMLFVRKAVHAAMLLAVVMISLAVLYAVLDAPFLFAVQIIVYTGAILMLFLFVLMLVGVDASDSVVETIRGQRVLAVLFGLVLGLRAGRRRRARCRSARPSASSERQRGGNIQALADIMFSRYVFAFETTSALLITAAVGAMVLAHRERLDPKPTQQRAGRAADAATTPTPARTSARCRRRASSPGTTRSTPRPCCPTAPPRSRRSPGCSRPAARCAPRRRLAERHRARSAALDRRAAPRRGPRLRARRTTEEDRA